MYLSEENFIEACRELKEKADKYPRQPDPIILHPRQYAEMKKRGWILDGKIDYKKMSEDIRKAPPEEGA